MGHLIHDVDCVPKVFKTLHDDAIQEMDVSVNRDGMSEEAAAQKWINEHQSHFDSFFGTLHDPNSMQLV